MLHTMLIYDCVHGHHSITPAICFGKPPQQYYYDVCVALRISQQAVMSVLAAV
jgi:hypothetical protein